MKNIIKRLIALLPSKRKLMQLYFALLFNANIKGFMSGKIYQGTTKQVCVPGLNCYSCPGAVGACPLGSLQGSFSADKSTLYYVGGILLIYSLMFGRFICGWLCPFGFIQELLYKIKTPKLKKSPVTRVLSYFKYVVLVFFVIIVPLMYAFRDTPLPAFCKYICPAGTLEGGIGLLSNKLNESYFSMLGPLFTWKFMLMISVVVGCVFVFRLFCRFVCPLGALYGLFNKISLFGIKVKEEKCTNCGLCTGKCKLDVKKVGDAECINCGECIDVCPTKAIVWKGSGIFLHPNEIPDKNDSPAPKSHSSARLITRAVSAVLMVALLIGVFAYYWNVGGDISSDSSTEESSQNENSEIPYGNSIGERCYEKELEIITSDGFASETVNPAKQGKITIINFWGTWCTPCVAELPYFDQIATEYTENVSVIAIHTNMVSETAPEYIRDHYPESKITFARDSENEEYYNLLGGRGTYPYTVILDENGIVKELIVKSLTYEELKQFVEGLIEQ